MCLLVNCITGSGQTIKILIAAVYKFIKRGLYSRKQCLLYRYLAAMSNNPCLYQKSESPKDKSLSQTLPAWWTMTIVINRRGTQTKSMCRTGVLKNKVNDLYSFRSQTNVDILHSVHSNFICFIFYNSFA